MSKDNRRFLAVTRPSGKGVETGRYIEKLGWSPLIVNTVELKPRTENELYMELRHVLSLALPVDWMVFMSQEGVDVLFKLLQSHASLLPGILGDPKMVAVGPSTRSALQNWGIREIQFPGEYSSEGVGELLSRNQLQGKHILLARSTDANDMLGNYLRSQGATVSTVNMYSSNLPTDKSTVISLLGHLQDQTVDGLLFTSAQSASNLFTITQQLGRGKIEDVIGDCLIGAIGPMTGKRLRELGVNPTVQPDRYLVQDALRCMAERLLQSRGLSQHLPPVS